MSRETNKILQALRDYERLAPGSRGIELRLDLAEIIVRSLEKNGWTQRELAEKASMKESFISRIIHSDVNCTFETAGKLLFALAVSAGLIEVSEPLVLEGSAGETFTYFSGISNDQKIHQEIRETKTDSVKVERRSAS